MSEAVVPDKFPAESLDNTAEGARAAKRAKLAKRKQRRYVALGLVALWLVQP